MAYDVQVEIRGPALGLFEFARRAMFALLDALTQTSPSVASVSSPS
jgi:hypothetical protein